MMWWWQQRHQPLCLVMRMSCGAEKDGFWRSAWSINAPVCLLYVFCPATVPKPPSHHCWGMPLQPCSLGTCLSGCMRAKQRDNRLSRIQTQLLWAARKPALAGVACSACEMLHLCTWLQGHPHVFAKRHCIFVSNQVLNNWSLGKIEQVWLPQGGCRSDLNGRASVSMTRGRVGHFLYPRYHTSGFPSSCPWSASSAWKRRLCSFLLPRYPELENQGLAVPHCHSLWVFGKPVWVHKWGTCVREGVLCTYFSIHSGLAQVPPSLSKASLTL